MTEVNGPMVVVDEAAVSRNIAQMFRTALLLTASVERAETALLQAIQSLHPDDSLADGLLRETVRASTRASVGLPEQQEEELKQASSMVPCELQHVLRLPRDLRLCFVLRFLVGLSRRVCARLLHVKLSQIDEDTFAALRQLSTFTNYLALQSA
ncbi:MAG TPA: hypothetical protein VHZ55_29520 [Bryobacteraceae bacterium]|jgi:DNA-directed RNA polymerase specialized sigma24 family protein|nr:hypothetical protein [Bryobacteraceae bacterium]